MTHAATDQHRYEAPDPDWEDRIREEEAAREAYDDERLHAILDEGGRVNGSTVL